MVSVNRVLHRHMYRKCAHMDPIQRAEEFAARFNSGAFFHVPKEVTLLEADVRRLAQHGDDWAYGEVLDVFQTLRDRRVRTEVVNALKGAWLAGMGGNSVHANLSIRKNL